MAILTEKFKVDQDLKQDPVKRNRRGYMHDDDTSKFSITIGQTQAEIFSFWRDFKNLTLSMNDIKDIRIISAKKSHWTVELKSGLKAECDAEITDERVNEMIAWKSTKSSEVETSGSVWFSPAPGGRCTVVSLLMDYSVPGGKLTELLTKITGEDPDSLAFINLRRLKAYLETGEIPTVEGQSSGREEIEETQFKH